MKEGQGDNVRFGERLEVENRVADLLDVQCQRFGYCSFLPIVAL
jgi:hypothetical protein